ncbi:MAG: hypothetical protein EP326_15425, partial [Deltaproteobacteria bacterium]
MKAKEVGEKIKSLQKFIDTKSLDGLYISSFDIFLSEYVPLGDNHRYYVSGFSGSVAEVLIPKTGRALLFVDGRYHEQADKEVDQSIVEVVKVPYGVDLAKALIQKGKEIGIKNLGIEGDRAPLGFEKELGREFEVVAFDLGEVAKLIDAPGFVTDSEVKAVADTLTGETVKSKIKKVVGKGEGFF